MRLNRLSFIAPGADVAGYQEQFTRLWGT